MVPCVADFYVPGLGVCVQLVVDFRDTALHRIRNADVYLFYLLPVMAADQRVQDTFVERVGREEQLIDDTAMFYRIGDKRKSVERIERPQEKNLPGLGQSAEQLFQAVYLFGVDGLEPFDGGRRFPGTGFGRRFRPQ